MDKAISKPNINVNGKSPKVSVIVPAYNHEAYVEDAITSILNQTYPNIEIVIVDDGSTDQTPQIIQNFAAAHPDIIVYSRHTENKGVSQTINDALAVVQGEFLVFASSDDLLPPTSVENRVKYLLEHPEISVVVTDFDVLLPNQKQLSGQDKFQVVPQFKRLYDIDPQNIYEALLLGNFIPACTVAVSLRNVSRQDLMHDPQCPNLHDYEGWLRLAHKYRWAYLRENTWIYRWHDANFSKPTAGKLDKSFSQLVYVLSKQLTFPQPVGRKELILKLIHNQSAQLLAHTKQQTDTGLTQTAAIIVTYNSENSIRTCIDSVLENTRVPAEIVVVDNASRDGTREILASYGDRITTILNDENLGFSAACNQGINAAAGDYVVLLNPDTLVTPGWLGQLLAHFAPDVGAVGPLSDYVAGRQKFQLYLPEKRPAELNLLSLMDLLRQHNHRKTVETKLLIGFCMALSRAALDDVGLLDEDLFLGNDDLDISWRLRNAGYKLLVATDTFVHHEGQVSFKTEAKSKTDALVQQSTDRLYEKLVAHYGEGNVPPPQELWEMDWFNPTNAHFRQPLPDSKPKPTDMTSIIILVHNQLELTMDCLDSIEAHTPEPHEIIIVDNASTDGTSAFLRQYLLNHHNVRVIRNDENLGFAAGNNQALTLAHGNFVVFLNNDTVVSPNWLGKMLAVMAQYPDVGIVGPVSNSVSGPQNITPAEPYSDIDGFVTFANRWAEANRGQSTEFFRIVGFCMLVRRDVIDRIGGWDERYDIGNFEDDDFCIRAALAGFKARIAQDVFIHHIGGQTFRELSIDYEKQINKNWQIFSEKWRIPGSFQQGTNYYDVVMAQKFREDYLSVPTPNPATVLPLEVSRKASSLVVILNTMEAESPEQCAASFSALRTQLPTNAEADIWLAGDKCSENIPADVPRKAEPRTALADALAVAKTVVLVSADVTFAPSGLARLLAAAEHQSTVAVVTPLADHAPDACQIDLPADETAFDEFAAERYQQYGEKTASVPYAGGFCLLLKAHHVRVSGGFSSDKNLPDALAEVFRNLQKLGFAVARAEGIVVRHTHLSDAEGAQLAQIEATRRQTTETVAAQTALGMTLLAQGETEPAIAAFKKAVELSPDDVALKNQLGLAYFQTGNTGKAKKIFQRILTQNPENLHTHLFLLDLFRGEKRYRKAIAHAKSALEIDPFNVDVLVAYGLLMLDLDDLDGAEMAWQRLANAPADNPGVLALMKGLLARGSRQVSAAAILPEIDSAMKTEDWSRAETLLDTALNASGENPIEKAALWNRLGTVYFQMGNITAALDAFNEGRNLDPENVNILNNLAQIYYQQGELDNATGLINCVLKIDPNDADALMLLGNCAIQLEDLDVARMAFQRVQEVAPETEGINELVQKLTQLVAEPLPVPVSQPAAPVTQAEMLARVELAQQAGRWSEAADRLAEIMRAQNGTGGTDRAELLNQLGVAQFMAGNLSEASETLRTALETSPDNRVALGNLADVLAAQGKFDEATGILNRILAVDPDDVPTLMSLGNCAIQLEALDVAQMAFERVQTLAPETDGVSELVRELQAITASPTETPSVDGNSETPTEPIFIGGAGRSGTTLVRVMLDSHPHIACGPEMKILPVIAEMLARVELTLPPVMDEYRLNDAIVYNAFNNLVSQFLEPYLRQSGKRRIAEKTPHNVAYFPQLHRMFPDSPLIHVIRDGRDVVASLLKMDWVDVSTGERMSITTDAGVAAQYWVEMVTAARRAIDADDSLRQRYVEIFYEELVARPEAVMRQLFDFLGEPWDESVLAFYNQSHSLGGESSAEQVSQPIYSNSVGRWQTDLSADQKAAVKAVAGDLLIELGYAKNLEW